MRKKVVHHIQIEDMGAEGKCVARHEGKVIFTSFVAPGDVVDLQLTRKRKKYAEAIPVAFHEYASIRDEPFCQHFGTCGGCKWQHIQYEHQLFYKQKQVKDNLERIGHLTLPPINTIIASKETRFYRNKLEFTFSNKRWLTLDEIRSDKEHERRALGFHMPGRFDKVLDIDECYLQEEPSNSIRLFVKKVAIEENIPFFDLVTQEGFLRTMIIRTANTGEVMVLLQVTSNNKKYLDVLFGKLQEAFPAITSIFYFVNDKKNDSYADLEPIHYYGEKYITEKMEGLEFRIGPKSFYQTNSDQAYTLYKVAREFAGLTGNELVYDLYTGTGTIANFIAKDAKAVVGIEYIPEAIEDAEANSQLNNIDNTHFFSGDMKDVLTPDFIAENEQPDVIITDPPRAGMHQDVVNAILQAGAPKIVYVSCNPATQARDLEWLSEKYKVVAVQPVDMFPQTAHVENVVLLEMK